MFAAISLLAVHAADARPAAFNIDLLHLLFGSEDLVHRKDVAHIRVAGVAAALAGRVGDHLHHARAGLLGGGGDLDIIVQALAHLVHAVDTHDLGELGELGLRFKQAVGVVADN